MKLLWIIPLIIAVIVAIVFAFRQLIEMVVAAVHLSVIAKKIQRSSSEEDENEKGAADSLS